MFCLSKGLASPVGSLLVGEADFIERARRVRKAMGGGMRQSGVLAACGLTSLREMIDRLAEDHANARRLAEGLNASGLVVPVDLDTVETNILIAELAPGVADPSQIPGALESRGLLCTSFPPRFIRLCTHCDVSTADVDAALGIIREVAAELGLAPVGSRT
jgi:threonine aldolase